MNRLFWFFAGMLGGIAALTLTIRRRRDLADRLGSCAERDRSRSAEFAPADAAPAHDETGGATNGAATDARVSEVWIEGRPDGSASATLVESAVDCPDVAVDREALDDDACGVAEIAEAHLVTAADGALAHESGDDRPWRGPAAVVHPVAASQVVPDCATSGSDFVTGITEDGADDFVESEIQVAQSPIERLPLLDLEELQAPPATCDAERNEPTQTPAAGEYATAAAVVRVSAVPAVHRDRRGRRRSVTSAAARPESSVQPSGVRPPAEISIRLSFHPIQRTVRLSLVPSRPDGFPASVTVEDYGTLQAYDEGRYDDVDVPDSAGLLDREIRLRSLEGFRFLRSARRIQIFSTTPTEPDFVSVSAARANAEHAILCRSKDAGAVRQIAGLAGSPPLSSHAGWAGVPAGCEVLSNYIPVRSVGYDIEPWLRPMDPSASISIGLSGGLEIEPRNFAQGHPPLIDISGLPDSATVTIGGERAHQTDDGDWVSPSWDAPGRHTVDVMPGPSLTYEIVPDPALEGGWTLWNAHPERWTSPALPWELAEICGAHIGGPAGSELLAAEPQPLLVALDCHSRAVPLRRRPDLPVSVAAVPPGAAFLLAASGLRRHQGHVTWVGGSRSPQEQRPCRPDDLWITTVRRAASQRLRLVDVDPSGEAAWRLATERARRLRRNIK